MYVNGNKRSVKTILRGEEGIKENDGGEVNSAIINCKDFCTCHNVSPVNNNKRIFLNKTFFKVENLRCLLQ
jgi:hypothetical protein